MAGEAPKRRKFTTGPFKDLIFTKKDHPEDATKIIIEIPGYKRTYEVAKGDYNGWGEKDAI
jgi:hypothetical protein